MSLNEKVANADTRAAQQYFDALKRIMNYMTPDQIRRDAKNVGLGYQEYLEMSYENILSEAKRATHNKRRPK